MAGLLEQVIKETMEETKIDKVDKKRKKLIMTITIPKVHRHVLEAESRLRGQSLSVLIERLIEELFEKHYPELKEYIDSRGKLEILTY